jgi:Alg9-like mannosyltransferase family
MHHCQLHFTMKTGVIATCDFRYGYLTWEWRHGLRGYLYPASFASVYKLLALLHIDSRTFLVSVYDYSIFSTVMTYCTIVLASWASAAALSTVLRKTTFSYGKHAIFRFLPNQNPSADQYEILRDCKFTRFTKNGWNRLTGGSPKFR